MRSLGFVIGVKIAVPLIVFLFIATFMLYPFRNGETWVVAERFLRNNELIKSEAGDIKDIRGMSPDISYRSEQIADGLKRGENLSDVYNSKDFKKPELVIKREGYIAETGKLNGSKKSVEFQIYFEKIEWFNRGIYYYVVREAIYRDEAGNWQNIPIGWTDNYFLLYK